MAGGSIELSGLTKRFGEIAVDNIDLTVASGEFFSLLGPSGCGKTTTLRLIAGFEQPTSGRILLDGVDVSDVPPHRRKVNTVFQSYALFPFLDVRDNVAFGLRHQGAGKAELKRRVDEALDLVHMTSFAKRRPGQLSGGQQQRVALARALVLSPAVLLLDEPLGALDAKLREQMQLELIRLQKESGVTFVFVTHAQAEALALSHRIAVMNNGRIEQLDEPSRLYGLPRNRFVADFIGNVNMIEATVASVGTSLTLDLPTLGKVVAPSKDGVHAGQKGVFVIRPEQVTIRAPGTAADEANQFDGHVHDFLYIGDVTTYLVDLASGARVEALLANSGSGRATFFEVGDAVSFGWRADAGHFLEA